MTNIRPIRTESEYETSLREVEILMEKAVQGELADDEGDRLEVLAILVEAYENKHYPIPAPDPAAVVAFDLERFGLTEQLERLELSDEMRLRLFGMLKPFPSGTKTKV